MLPFTEDLLHFIWQNKLFATTELFTTSGETLHVEHSGNPNPHAGPDFEMAKVRISGTLMAGSVEIHRMSSDWHKHGHQHDERYANVILHVVWQNDLPLQRHLPVLELEHFVNNSLLTRYQMLMENSEAIACSKLLKNVPPITLTGQIEKCAVERLQQKTTQIQSLLPKHTNDWEQTAWTWLAHCWGAPVNSQAFAQMAEMLPVKLFAKHNDPIQIAALIFGCAGFLDRTFDDNYPALLRKEFTYLQKLHGLAIAPNTLFRFSQMRPQNFPTVRLAQLAAFVSHHPRIFSELQQLSSPADFAALAMQPLHEYWHSHFDFDKRSAGASVAVGKLFFNTLVINAVVPLLFALGRYRGEELLCEKALRWLTETTVEKNNITRLWQTKGVQADNAFQSQGLIGLFKNYCSKKECVRCNIGRHIFAGRA